jgi:peptidoglycan/LPS O-acetylase OafA/YrhL
VRKYVRIPALDFTKGALVLIMVLYHWLNYFVSVQGNIYRYLRFLTPSFIFISGFLISHVYFAGYGINDSRVPKRLMQRGLKILAVFIALNIVRTYLIPDPRNALMPSQPWSLDNLMAVFVTGNVAIGGIKGAAFPILVPISYLLLLSAGMVILCRFYKYTVHIASLAGVICIGVLWLHGLGSGNLELVTVGLLGVLVGYIPIETVGRFLKYPVAIGAAYASYLIVITVWPVTYPVQLFGVFLNLMLIYALGSRRNATGKIQNTIELLGKYSLFGYIAQIAILQALFRALRHMNPRVAASAVAFVAALALTIISVEILHRLRRRAAIVDNVYQAVFA